MARAYSGVLGSIAMCLIIVRGLMSGSPPNDILTQCLVVFFVFGLLGFWIGYVAETTVTESVEIRFRSEMARQNSAAANGHSETSE